MILARDKSRDIILFMLSISLNLVLPYILLDWLFYTYILYVICISLFIEKSYLHTFLKFALLFTSLFNLDILSNHAEQS